MISSFFVPLRQLRMYFFKDKLKHISILLIFYYFFVINYIFVNIAILICKIILIMKKVILIAICAFAVISCGNEDNNLSGNENGINSRQDYRARISKGEDLFNSIFLLNGTYVSEIQILNEQKMIYESLPAETRELIDGKISNDKELIMMYISDNEPDFFSKFENEMFSKDAYRMREAYKEASDIVFNALKVEMLDDIRNFASELVGNQVPMTLFEETNFQSLEDIKAFKLKLETEYNVVTGKSKNLIKELDANVAITKTLVYNQNTAINEVFNFNIGANYNKIFNIIWVSDYEITNKLILDIHNAI